MSRICKSLRRLAIFLLVTVAGAAVPTAAWATFPGVPGMIVYPKILDPGEDAGEAAEVTGGLFAYDPAAAQPAQALTTNPTDGSPSYSPDGRLIVFERRTSLWGKEHLYVMNAGGGDVRQLTSGHEDSDPSFSPDGRRIVFARIVSNGSHIFTVNLDGSRLRQVTSGRGFDTEPVFTRGGKRIVFTSNRDHDRRGDHCDIFSVAADGSGLRVLIDGPSDESEPDVSPSGHRIAYTAGGHRIVPSTNKKQSVVDVFVAEIDGRGAHPLTRCSRSHCNFELYAPVWAPDEKQIAFVSLSGLSPYLNELKVMRPDGTHRQTLDREYGLDGIGELTWAPQPR